VYTKEQKIMKIRSGLVACGLLLAISIQFAVAAPFTVTNTTGVALVEVFNL
jgi:hypothetical protein